MPKKFSILCNKLEEKIKKIVRLTAKDSLQYKLLQMTVIKKNFKGKY